MHRLCLRVKSGKLNPANVEDSCNSFVVCKVGADEWRTMVCKGLFPVYDTSRIFEVPMSVTHVIVEVWEKKFLRSVMCSVLLIDLMRVPFRNHCGTGCWHVTKPVGNLAEVDHILLDLHYMLPLEGASSEEIEQLEKKMDILNKVQEDEINTLKTQSYQKNFTEIKGRNLNRSKPGVHGSSKPMLNSESRNSSMMTIDSGCSDYGVGVVTNESGSLENGDGMSTGLTSHLSRRSSLSLNSDGNYSSISQPSVINPRISVLTNNHHLSDQYLDPNFSRSTSQFSLVSDEVDEESEVSKEALMWMSAVERIRKQNYLKREREENMSPGGGDTFIKRNGTIAPATEENKEVDSPFSENQHEKTNNNVFDTNHITNNDQRPVWDDLKLQQLFTNFSKPKQEISSAKQYGDFFSDIHNYETLKPHVFQKTIQALIYPISLNEPHKFHSWTTMTPAYCYECERLLWGVTKQGMKCSACGVKCHEKCQELLNADCLQRAAQKSFRGETEDAAQHENIMRAIEQRMKVTENMSKDTFELLRNAFGYDGEKLDSVKKEVKHLILTGSSKWSSKIEITVVEAQGLTGKDKSGTSDPYVTVQVGKTKKTTSTIPQDLNPKWDETFSFDCNNSSDRIKVRVWDEDDDLKSKVMAHLRREADDFLGQTIIDVKQLCGETDVWLDLKQRTDRSDVSGQIHLKMTLKIEGEEQMSSYHIQYQILHGTLFNHLCDVQHGVVIPPGNRKLKLDETEEWPTFFDGPAQDIVEEFATRYGIESIFMAMTQFSCLTQRFITKKDARPQDVSSLLVLINSHYRHKNGQEINVSNFGKQKFTTVLDRLQSSLKENLASYKAVYPTNGGRENLEDLKNTIDLLTSIVFFRLKVLQQANNNNNGGNTRQTLPATTIIKDRVKACLKKTYEFISTKTDEVYDKDTGNTDISYDNSKIAHWNKLIALILMEIKEDGEFYAPIFNTFFPHSELSAQTFWEFLSKDLEKDLTENVDVYLRDIPTSYMMSLQMTVSYVYDRYISPISDYENTLPDYPHWFEPFVMKHLDESDKMITGSFLDRSLDKDTFTADSGIKHSSSVIDIFSSLTAGYDSLHKMKCPVPVLRDKYHNRFCETINSALLKYTDRIMEVFNRTLGDLKTSCVILCNIHQVRDELQSLYKTMGGDLLVFSACKLLENTQKRLKEARNKLIQDMVANMSPLIEKAIKDIKNDLRLVKSNKKEDYTDIVAPMIEYFDVVFQIFVNKLYEPVRKPLLRQTWKRTLKLFEEIIILPDINSLAHEEVQELNSKQSQVVETMLDGLKMYFTENSGRCLKQKTLERMDEMKDLRKVLSQYRLTTDYLIKNFVEKGDSQNQFADDDSQGEIQLQVDLFTSPGQEHHDCTVKVVSASRLHWNTTKMFRPFVEVNLIGPGTSGIKRKYTTSTKNKTSSPLFNESFSLRIMKPNDPMDYELQFSVKDWCFMKTDLLVGVAVMPLKNVVETGSFQDRLSLGRSIYLTKANKSIVIILSQRIHDEVAQEFVKLKQLERTEIV